MKDSIIQKVIGYILLIPPIMSVAIFVLQIFIGEKMQLFSIQSSFFCQHGLAFLEGLEEAFFHLYLFTLVSWQWQGLT
ncbi:MAG: hypothetical protein HWD62_19700 [Cyclobacteriaceae bacterium]|nr:MAG: hypothetical protein HWD62_19700 [Cyclobacteriaceae bacterium]